MDPIADPPLTNDTQRPCAHAAESAYPNLISRSQTKLSIRLASSSVLLSQTEALTQTLSEFCLYVDEHRWLQQARIITVEGYYQIFGVIKHRFVLLELSSDNQRSIWLRLDRRRGKRVSILQFVAARGQTVANDTASLSSNKSILIPHATLEDSQVLMNRPSLSDLNRLLLIIVEELRIYNIWPENCWFFSSLVRQHIAAADFSLLSPEKINVKHVELGRDIREQLFARYYWGPEPDSGIQLLPLGVTLKALKRVKPSPPNSHRVLSSVEANLAIVYSAANRTDNARNFMITLHQLARSFAAHSCVNEVLALIAYSRHIAPKAYAGYDLDSEVANSFYLEGYTLYRGGRHSSAVESLKKSIQLYHKLDPLNNVQTLRNLIRSHNTISWAHVETEPKLALENALEATQLAEIGDQRFGSGPNSHLAWCRWLLPQSLSAVSKAYLGIENFKEAQLHGRRAAELSREAFNSHASPDTAAVFAYALNRYETSLDALGLHEDTDLDELCSPNEWRNMLPWLNNTWSAFSYVAGRVEALNKSS